MAAKMTEVMTIRELAEYLNISKSMLYELVQNGRVPGRKVGKRWRFHKAATDDWPRQHPAHTESKPRGQE